MVAGFTDDGEIVLRPVAPTQALAVFPDEEFTKGKKGKSPFKRVDERLAKGSNGAYKAGDLLCNKDWSVWKSNMSLGSDEEPRAYTPEEVRTRFLHGVWDMVDWWDAETQVKSTREKMEGLAFSILAILDGAGALPSFIVAPSPHPSDEQYHKDEGTNWYPTDEPDIAGSLHDLFYTLGRTRGRQ